MKRLLFLFFAFLFVSSFFSQPLIPVLSQTSGTFYGFDYEYGEQTKNFTKSVSHSRSFSESESSSRTRNYTVKARIRTGLVIKDVFWQRWTNRSKAAPNSSWELPGAPQNWRGYRRDGFLTNGTGAGGAWYRYNGISVINWGVGGLGQALNISWFGRRVDMGLSDFNSSLPLFFNPKWTWMTSYVNLTSKGTSLIPMQDLFGTIHDYTSVDTYLLEYKFDSGTVGDHSDDVVVFEEMLIPQFAFVHVVTTPSQVNVTETASVAASLSGQFNFSGTWTENLHGQHVSIKDGTSYWFDYFALISGNVDYEYEGGITIDGSLSTNITREVSFAVNGTPISESIRPVHLQILQLYRL